MNALLIDIGNTRVKWRFLDAVERDPSAAGVVDDDAALALSEIDRLAGVWRAITGAPLDVALISNVASADMGIIVERSLRGRWPGIRIASVAASAVRGGVANGYADPRQLGVDRWMAMIGAHALMPARSLLVCSFGTATTIDLLMYRPETSGAPVRFVGGMILPGVDAMRRALIDGTARLPDRPGRFVAFADNTDDAITTGVLAAQVGAVERAWRDACTASADPSLACIVAGGSAATIAPRLEVLGMPTRVVPDLVLRGLAVLAREAWVN